MVRGKSLVPRRREKRQKCQNRVKEHFRHFYQESPSSLSPLGCSGPFLVLPQPELTRGTGITGIPLLAVLTNTPEESEPGSLFWTKVTKMSEGDEGGVIPGPVFEDLPVPGVSFLGFLTVFLKQGTVLLHRLPALPAR